jgi:hypothetical protein
LDEFSMKRTTALQSLFTALLVGCGPQVELDDTGDDGDPATGTSGASTTSVGTTAQSTTAVPTATSPTGPDTNSASDDWSDGSCPDEVYLDVAEIPRSEIERWLDVDGNVVPDGCWGACSAVGIYGNILSCSVSPLDGGSDTSGGLDTGGGFDSGGDDGTPPPGTSGGTFGTDGGEGTGTSGGDPLMRIECEWMEECLGGRGHASLRSDGRTRAGSPIGRWAATCAHAEAASVPAFLGLARELMAHGAPSALRDRALDAAREEVAHARMMSRIAGRHGATVQQPRFDRLEVRDLETIATENAVEGCVRETWAALEASYQSEHATSPTVRAVMQRICDDETRHAELARDIDTWCRSRLDAAACARVDAARDLAVANLLAQSGGPVPPEIRQQLGLPTAQHAHALKRGLRAALWN